LRRSPAFLHRRLVAFGNLLDDPSGNVLGRRIERQQLVEVTVIEVAVNLVLDPLEIADHSVGIQFFCLAEHRYDPIMAV